jgi:hypothetical protein
LERTYFYNSTERQGRYLLDEQLGLTGRLSSGLQKQAVKLAAWLPYKAAEEVMAELAGLCLSDSGLWQLIQKLGSQVQPIEVEEKPSLPLPATRIAPPTNRDVESTFTTEGPTSIAPISLNKQSKKSGVGLDGVMIHIRGEGYKETKLGCFFEVENYLNEEGKLQAHAAKQSYCFYLGGPEEFGRRVVLAAQDRGWESSDVKQVLGDGACWIWNVAAEHFKAALEVIDWYHAKQHLWQAANLLFGESSLKAAQMVEVYGNLLFEGCADLIAAGLVANLAALTAKEIVSVEKQELIEREANYFRHNQFRMEYQKYRETGWPIGSGVVESGCKLFKQRFGGSGMRWNRSGAENLMPFRAAVMGNNFEQVWQQLCPQT